MSDYRTSADISLTGNYMRELAELFAGLEKAAGGAKTLKDGLSNVRLGGSWLREASELTEKIVLADRVAKALAGNLSALKVGPSAVESLAGLGERLHALDGVVGQTVDAINKRLSGITLGGKPHESIAAFRDDLGTLQVKAGDVAGSIKVEFTNTMSAIRTEAGTVKEAIAGWGGELAIFEGRLRDVQARMADMGQRRGGVFGDPAPAQGNSGSGYGSPPDRGGRGRHAWNEGINFLGVGPTDNHSLAGMNVGHMFKHAWHDNAELEAEKNRYRGTRASEGQVQAATSAAYSASRQVPGVGVADAFRMFREVAGETGDDAGAAEILPTMLRAKVALRQSTGHASEQDMLNLMKTVTLHGGAIDEKNHKIDVGKFKEGIDASVRAIVASQNLLKTNDLLQAQKQGGAMLKTMSMEDMYQTMVPMYEELGGSRVGTGMAAVGRQFVGGIMKGETKDRWRELGLLNTDRFGDGDGHGWHYNKQHHVVIDDPSKAIKGYQTLMDPKGGFTKMVEEVLRPALVANGITDREAQNAELYRVGGTETERRLFSMALTSPELVETIGERFKKALHVDEYNANLESDPNTAAEAFSQSLHTLNTAIVNSKNAAPGMMTLAKGIAGFAEYLNAHPVVGSVGMLAGAGASAGLHAVGAARQMMGYGLPAAATQLSAAAIHLEAAAVTMKGGTAAKVAKNASVAAPVAAAAGFGLAGVTVGTAAAAGFGLYAAGSQIPKIAEKEGPGAIDPATGEHIGTDVPSTTPWLRNWVRDHLFGTPGQIQHRARGGFVFGPGGPTSDSIPTMLSSGEFVVSAAAAARNKDLLEALNSGSDMGGVGGGSRSVAAMSRIADPTERATLALAGLWSVLHRLGELGLSGGSGGAGGGGVQVASLGGGGGFTSGFGGGAGSVAGLAGTGGRAVSGVGNGSMPRSSDAGSLTALIDAEAKRAGIDPRIMQGIRAGESGHRGDYDVKSDSKEDSYGPFQLNRRGGLGATFEKETGLDARDPKTIPAQTRWVAELIKKRGRGVLKQWYGYKGDRDADPRWGNSGYVPNSAAGDGAVAGLANVGGAGGQSKEHIQGHLTMEGKSSDFGSGGHGAPSIPFGTYPITPGTVGAWGKAHGALGINNNAIWDKSLGRMRQGIEIHAASNANMITAGCIGIAKEQYGAFKAHVLDVYRRRGQAYLTVGPDGNATVTGDRPDASGNVARAGRGPQSAPASRPEASLPRPSNNVPIHVHSHIDGRKVASSVTQHQFNKMNGPGRGANFADRGRLYPQAA